jgi:hypothetical protein
MKKNGDLLGLGPLQDTILELSGREISILQIAKENMGVITLSKTDCRWIEQVARASLENDKDYFLKSDTPLNFSFLYVQSYLIRTYLLYCRINYEHIKGKYQLFVQRETLPITTAEPADNEEPFSDEEWNHLDQKNLDQLQTESDFLQQTLDIIKTSPENYSSMKLSEFVRLEDYQHRFAQSFEQHCMKDFSLSQISNVLQFYKHMINQVQHAFMDVSQLLRVPLKQTLNDDLDKILTSSYIPSRDQTNKEEFQGKIRTINEFLNDLKGVEVVLADQYAQSLSETCKVLEIENPVLALIPKEIKCENYVSLCLKLIEVRSQLQERTIDIEEKKVVLWNARFDIANVEPQAKLIFDVFRNKDDDTEDNDNADRRGKDGPMPMPPTPHPTDSNGSLLDCLVTDYGFNPRVVARTELPEPTWTSFGTISNTALANLKIKSIILSPSTLFEASQTQATATSKLANAKFQITFLDGTLKRSVCKPEKFYAQLKKILDEKKIDLNSMVVIDPHRMSVDFTLENVDKTPPTMEAEYRVVERASLIAVIVGYEDQKLKYSVTADAKTSTVLGRFIFDQKLQFTPPESYFSAYDLLGRYIADDGQLNQLYRHEQQGPIEIRVLRCSKDMNICCEVMFTENQGNISMDIAVSD